MKKVIVIGAGLAGLTAGIYAQKSGFDVTIVEQHTIAGGMCTSWRRKGYLFEGAMHWLTGSSDKTYINRLWREVGALSDDVNVFYHEPFQSVETSDGGVVHLYRDMERTERELAARYPNEKKALKKLMKDVKKLTGFQMPVSDEKDLKVENPSTESISMLKMLPILPLIMKLTKMSTADYMSMFKNPDVRGILSMVPDDNSANALIFTLATLAAGDGGYPEGGSLEMVGRMVDTFKKAGGTLMLGTKVERVLEGNGAAAGVRLENGETLDADAVIVTLDVMAAARLFEAPPTDDWFVKTLRETEPCACTFVSVGVHTMLPDTPTFKLDQPIDIGGIKHSEISFNNYCGWDGYAPEGCTALTAIFSGDCYEFWKKAREDGRYEQEKQAIADKIEHILAKKYPQTEGKIDVIDVATPLTYERYTGAYHGSWMSTSKPGDMSGQLASPCELERCKNLYFAGHRVMPPGGMPVALSTGRRAAQLLCKQFDATFKA